MNDNKKKLIFVFFLLPYLFWRINGRRPINTPENNHSELGLGFFGRKVHKLIHLLSCEKINFLWKKNFLRFFEFFMKKKIFWDFLSFCEKSFFAKNVYLKISKNRWENDDLNNGYAADKHTNPQTHKQSISGLRPWLQSREYFRLYWIDPSITGKSCHGIRAND